jgi:hypothetical protein
MLPLADIIPAARQVGMTEEMKKSTTEKLKNTEALKKNSWINP